MVHFEVQFLVEMKRKHVVQLSNIEDKTLFQFAKMPHFNYWLYEQIKPYCSGHILELGSGIGNISRYLIADFSRVALSDVNKEYILHLRNTFHDHPHVTGIFPLDLNLNTDEIYFKFQNTRFDTVVATNVLEHIQDDDHAIHICRYLLAESGRLIILVPTYPRLFNHIDQRLHHFRRYRYQDIRHLIDSHGGKIIKHFYFNVAGLLGWWVNGTLLHKPYLSSLLLDIYERFIPMFKLFDRLLFNMVGISLICVISFD